MNEVFLVGVAEGVQDVLGNADYPTVGHDTNGGITLNQKLIPPLGFLPMNSTMGILETIEGRFRLDLDPFREMLTGFRKIPAFVKVRCYRNTSAYKYSLHIGTDPKLEAVVAFPPPDLRRLLVQSQLSNAFLRASSPSLNSAVITQSVRAFPMLKSTAIALPLGSYIGRILYPFGVQFLMPLFAVSLVREKETKIVAMMKIVCIFIVRLLPQAANVYPGLSEI
ncbi:UNVERIFIED_CONTAM: hypothetical protein HDU68_000544 [Siphonaria sp. JEL0065]|nr:hypothetical protein HDU68_000544 [Siphonaria sp. JEL0065]